MAHQCQRNVNFADANYIYNFEDKKHCGCKPTPPDCMEMKPPCCCRFRPTPPVTILENEEEIAEMQQRIPHPSCCSCGCEAVQSGCAQRVIPCTPIECSCENSIQYRSCCDANGCCCKYPCCCRNPFWPDFARPRWLCCSQLYGE